jgi:hypothetical protein
MLGGVSDEVVGLSGLQVPASLQAPTVTDLFSMGQLTSH